MSNPNYDFDDSTAAGVAGTPQGDGDFESDNLPSTGQTTAGGQLDTGEASHEPARSDVPGPQHQTGLERVIEELGTKLEEAIDEISTGKLLP